MIEARPAPCRRQRTLAAAATAHGVGLFTGCETRVTLRPAAADTGVRFRRTDLPGRPVVAGRHAQLTDRPRRTAVQDGAAEVQMIEHVMAALAGLRVDNVTVDIDGPELPGLDGSAAVWVDVISEAGILTQDAYRPTLTVAAAVEVRDGRGGLVRLEPPARPGVLELSYTLDHPHPGVGRRTAHAALADGVFAAVIADARTFVTESEVAALRAAGFGAGLTGRDLCVFADDPLAPGLGPGGLIDNALRGGTEPARHKLLDCVGDLALTGCDVVGRLTAVRSGHRLNQAAAGELLRTHAVYAPSARPSQAVPAARPPGGLRIAA